MDLFFSLPFLFDISRIVPDVRDCCAQRFLFWTNIDLMGELHARIVHKKSREVESSMACGEGVCDWVGVLTPLFLAKALLTEELRRCGASILRELHSSLAPGLGLVLILNGLRWAFVYEYVRILYGKSEPMNGSLLVIVSVGIEILVGTCSTPGYVGVGVRYISTLQLMKAISYVLVSMEESGRGGKRESPLGFIFLPTTCYQREYPKRERIRVKRSLLLLLLVPLFSVLSRYSLAVKTLPSAKRFLEELSFSSYVDLVLYANLGWASLFILVFVSSFALVSELTRFADASFFEDWWNAGVREYWRRWNKNVHLWIKRHLYIPRVRKGASPKVVSAWIFLGSGLAHEYVIGGAVGLRGAGFITMASQSLLIYLSDMAEALGVSEHLFCIAVMNLVGAPLMAVLVAGNTQGAGREA
jgi:MBOAT, membrane-bound O-acyltransferase family